MASSVTIAPSLGQPVLAFDGGQWDLDSGGAGGSMLDLRRMIEGSSCPQEGILDSAAWAVTATNGNMTVDVAADVGLAVVQGDSSANQGRYTVAPHSAAVTLDISPADASAPRLDMVILQVRDGSADGSGAFDARVLVLTGTPTAGAALDNRNGHATLPDTALLLADVLVPAGATSVTTADLRDRRRWARGALAKSSLNPGTYGAGVQYPGIAQRVECSGAPLMVIVEAVQVSGDDYQIGYEVDGAATVTYGSVGDGKAFVWEDESVAGSHLFRARLVSASGVTLNFGGRFIVRELAGQAAANNGTA